MPSPSNSSASGPAVLHLSALKCGQGHILDVVVQRVAGRYSVRIEDGRGWEFGESMFAAVDEMLKNLNFCTCLSFNSVHVVLCWFDKLLGVIGKGAGGHVTVCIDAHLVDSETGQTIAEESKGF